jgi:hypothetical protein
MFRVSLILLNPLPSGGFHFVSVGTQAIQTDVFGGFPNSPHANLGTVGPSYIKT